MSTPAKTGFPRGRIGWIVGTVILLVAGAIVGQVLGSIFLGLFIAAIVAIGWILAYESWRGGRAGGLDDPDDNGARL